MIVSTGNSDKVVRLENNNSAPLYLSTITISSSHFSILSHTCAVAPQPFNPNSSCVLTLRFDPAAVGALSGNVSVNFGKELDKTKAFNSVFGVSGTGIADSDGRFCDVFMIKGELSCY